jgi:hypothetical protein
MSLLGKGGHQPHKSVELCGPNRLFASRAAYIVYLLSDRDEEQMDQSSTDMKAKSKSTESEELRKPSRAFQPPHSTLSHFEDLRSAQYCSRLKKLRSGLY